MKLTKDILLWKGPHPLKNEYKKGLKFSQLQRNIIVGTLLGDAHLEPRGQNPSFRYYFSQKESQEAYVNHIYSNFEDWCSKEPQFANTGRNINAEVTKFVSFRTCTHPAFTFYANQFYTQESASSKRLKGASSHAICDKLHGYTRVIPKLLHKWLNPQVLAYWFMDDGCKDTCGYLLNTQNFSLEEQEILADALGRKFNFEVNIHKDRTNYRLYITAKSRDSFTQIIRPFILPSFEYKLLP